MDPLDNPAWYALTGPQAHFSEGTGLALRYDPEVGVFGALPDAPGAEAWEALARLVGPGGVVGVFQAGGLELPAGWNTVMKIPGVQMVAGEPIGEADDAFVELGSSDADDMLALVERTKPGPFLKRTHELGFYVGVREHGALIAMAGQRMRFGGYTEISAVCTDEQARKRGLATRLTRAVAAEIEERGDTPMLHASATNAGAIRVYEALGFAVRATFDFTIVQPPA
jgi:ribosomal protein S18 acetylase RimI-like enzyme